ncbi:Putative AprD family type I secretion system permease/ATPase [Candidatus Trichorickettsia mobilis]|uniref:AprD family type I secretion system permease/ATPase n=1 Tax=Candidatus Trichorickettsia mobilis TaxID=1346319 RepID=A0ABZ0URA2_9RICK|nr:type I secretion system permease/ATPase [Candidatus Trichorickettsia mobilis]WPY00570.1 Putative AprD family type I secretion system permease/ATPase [Candidatus Trichorickettsia mobilis]
MQNNPIDVDVLDKNLNLFTRAIKKCKEVFWITFWFAFVINLLMLITPLYSLQVLDRVIGSGSLNTLLMLSVIIGSVYFVYGLLQIARSFTLIKVGEWLDNNLSPALFGHAVSASATRVPINASQLLRDFQTVKTFLTSTGINTLFDAPWSIIYIIVIFLIHPYLGILTIVGALLIVSTAFFNAVATNKTLGEATEFSIKSLTQAEIASRNAEAVEAMGMMKNVTKNWQKFNQASLAKQSMASYRNGVISNFSRFIRNIMQMLVTGIGAYVVVTTSGKDMTTGGMIMSSIIVGRALAPFDNAIELWKSISGAMKSYKNINQALNSYTSRDESMPIPHVEGHLTVENVYYALPTPQGAMQPPTPQHILKGVSFSVQPGEILAIIGPSAAGKSTLAKVIVGVWKAASGAVRLDGGEIFRWNREDFGRHVGYLPQGIELFSGSIKQNIARMIEDADPEKVIAAAKIAGAHEMILRFPDGYDSDIGQAGSNLSGGQKQRIGLARAFYDSPKLVILDEPNANLDEAGEIALSNALKQAKAMNTAVIVISHRPSVLSVVDKILVIQDGAVAAYGSQDEIQNRVKMLKSGTIHINDK